MLSGMTGPLRETKDLRDALAVDEPASHYEKRTLTFGEGAPGEPVTLRMPEPGQITMLEGAGPVSVEYTLIEKLLPEGVAERLLTDPRDGV